MAIDLVGLLTGNNSLENQYQANDPWYQAARGIGSLQLAPGTNNTEAFLLPFLQGATAGGLAGYGRHSAQQTAYKDISSALNNIGYKPSPIADALAADQIQYGLDEMPENFSIKASTPDLLLALSQQSAKQEAAAKKAEALALLNPEIAAAKASFEKQVAQGTAEGKAMGEGQFNNADIKKDVTTTLNTQQSLKYVDQVIETAKKQNDGGKGAIGAVQGLLGTPNAEKQTLDAIGESMVGQVDKILGRETNSDARTRLINQFGPKWYDTDKEIQRKGDAFKEYLKSLSPSTPALQAAAPKPPAPPAGFELTGKQDANGNWGIRRIK